MDIDDLNVVDDYDYAYDYAYDSAYDYVCSDGGCDVYAKKTNSKPVVGICGSNIYVGQC